MKTSNNNLLLRIEVLDKALKESDKLIKDLFRDKAKIANTLKKEAPSMYRKM